jgi:hypothetical protein
MCRIEYCVLKANHEKFTSRPHAGAAPGVGADTGAVGAGSDGAGSVGSKRSMPESTCSVMLRIAYSRWGTKEKRVLSKEDGDD